MILRHCGKGGGCCENLITCYVSHPLNEGCVSFLSTGDVKGINGVCGVRSLKTSHITVSSYDFSCRSLLNIHLCCSL